MPEDLDTKLVVALVNAQRSVRAVMKDSVNNQHHYSYASSESLIDEARVALSNAGLCVLCPLSTWGQDGEADMLYSTFELLHVEGGKRVIDRELPILVHPGKTAAQAMCTAQTTTLAYMLRDLLLIARIPSDDAEKNAPPPKREAPPPPSETSVQLAKALEAKLANAPTLAELEALNLEMRADYEAKRISSEQLKPLANLREKRRRDIEKTMKSLETPTPAPPAVGTPGKAR